jgi:hypothetical protein
MYCEFYAWGERAGADAQIFIFFGYLANFRDSIEFKLLKISD